MPLPRRQDLGSHINDPIFGARDLANPLPKYHFPEHENRPEDIYQVVSDELYLDGNARQNLATFCQTWEEPEVHKLMDLVDRQEHDRQGPSIRKPRRSRSAASTCWPICGTPRRQPPRSAPRPSARREACMLGGMAAKWRWKAQAQGAGQTDRQAEPGLRPGAGLLGQVLRATGRSRSGKSRCGRACTAWTPTRCWKLSTRTPSRVVPTFGVTYTGQYEFVEPIAAALDKLQKPTRASTFDIHVDAASGGFLAPFVAPRASSGTSGCRA